MRSVVLVDGDSWFRETNGSAIVARCGPNLSWLIGMTMVHLGKGDEVDLGALRSFVGPHVPDREFVCGKCRGSGRDPMADDDCECSRCACDSCAGDGTEIVAAPSRPVVLADTVVNGNLVSAVLDTAGTDTGESTATLLDFAFHGTPYMRIATRDWFALVMALREDVTPETPRFPAVTP